jgi:hypothetical protein
MSEEDNNIDPNLDPIPEDSMEEIEYEETEESETLAPYQKDFDQVDKMLSNAIKLSSDSQMHEPTCPICCSPLRTEAEDLWDQNSRTVQPIKDLFKSKSGLKVSAEIIRHHMKNHKDASQELRKVEFIDDVRRLYNTEATTLDEIKLCLSIITSQIMSINSLGPSHDHSAAEIQKLKSAETNKLMGTYSNLIKLRAQILGEMKDNGEIISIPRDKFIRVFNEAVAEAQNDRETQIIMGILNGLKG